MRHQLYRSLFVIVTTLLALASKFLFSMQWQTIFIVVFFAILLSILIFPAQSEKKFRQSLIPILTAYENYLTVLIAVIYKEKFLSELLPKKIKVMKALNKAPLWVYRKGYNARLREGHRHFLIRIEQIGEVLFSVHALARQSFNKKLLKKHQEEIYFIRQQTIHLIQSIITALSLQKPEVIIDDWLSAIENLEKVFVENFSKEQGSMPFIQLMESFKDLRFFLIKCVQALR